MAIPRVGKAPILSAGRLTTAPEGAVAPRHHHQPSCPHLVAGARAFVRHGGAGPPEGVAVVDDRDNPAMTAEAAPPRPAVPGPLAAPAWRAAFPPAKAPDGAA